MKIVALVSGGKDSCYNMMQCVAAGHEVVALANLVPYNRGELDSYMYQSVAHEGVALMGEALDLPLYRLETTGKAHSIDRDYVPTEHDEVEDLYLLLQRIQGDMEIGGVAVGAILSDYQRVRVENVCARLGLVSFAYLWRRDQAELLHEMIECGVRAVLVKVATLGLDPGKHLGRSIAHLQPHLLNMKDKYGLNVCGEGGEYETFTLDCPLYVKTIVIDESETVIHSDNAIAPVGYLRLNKLRLVPKKLQGGLVERLSLVPVKDADGYITDPAEEASEDALCKDESSDDDDDEENKRDHVERLAPDAAHPVVSMATNNGWLWCGGLAGHGNISEQGMLDALNKLENCLKSSNFSVKDVCAINMFVRDMSQYAVLNKLYCRLFSFINPPTRVCVQVPLPARTHVLLEVLAWQPTAAMDPQIDKQTLHVQGISHWAPANIGPYSQAIRVGDIICVAGQIGLVPGNMTLVKGGIKQQCQLTLRHIGRIVKAVDPATQLRDVVQGLCYVTKAKYIEYARREWEERTNNSIVDYVVVSELPRGALIEWHVWAHRHNNEETGKCIDSFAISIRRRWNYENNVAAIMSHIAYTEPQPGALPGGLFEEVLLYTLTKLNQNYDTESSVSYLRLFYPVNKEIDVDLMHVVLKEMQSSFHVVYTVVPVCSLENDSILLSICGIRNE